MKIYKIQYQEVDANRRLRIYTLENMLLNAAGSNADDMGIGVKYLLQQNCTWVITNMSLEVSYLPTHGEKIGIETWVENAAHLLSVRNFLIWLVDENGEKIAQIGKARSVWAVIHLEDRTIQNVFEQDVFLNYNYGEKIDIARMPHLRGIVNYSGVVEHQIVYSDIDYNGHCNSCKYLEFMLNAYEPSPLKELLPKNYDEITSCQHKLRVDLKYAKELYKGENAKILFLLNENNSVTYEVKNAKDEMACSALISVI